MKNEVQIVDGKFYKKCKVVVLPAINLEGLYTKDWLYRNRWDNSLLYGQIQRDWTVIPHHLYILSDEEIQEGNWFINHENTISRAAPRHVELFPKIKHQCKKIIATTDSLGLAPFGGQDILELPRPSNEFLKKFCELGGIDEALVEYEYNHDDTVPYPKTVEGETYKLKVSPDNTITIKPIKDSWNREEVENLIYRSIYELIMPNGEPQFVEGYEINNWIEENL